MRRACSTLPLRILRLDNPATQILPMVFRDKPVRLAISRMAMPSRRCQRLITLNNATSITPESPARSRAGQSLNVGQNSMQISAASGSVLRANQHPLPPPKVSTSKEAIVAADQRAVLDLGLGHCHHDWRNRPCARYAETPLDQDSLFGRLSRHLIG